MRLQFISFLILLTTALAYFSQQQVEILNVHYAIQPKSSDTARSFYEILNVKKGDSMDKIEKSFRKLSRKFHPDKFISKPLKERKKAERKYETLGLIMNILRDVDKRHSYDYFLKKGFPVYDAVKNQYVFKHKSQTKIWPMVLFIIVFGTLINFLVVKLNKNSKSKQVKQIIRDVNWKADNIDKSSPKVMEIPDDIGINSGKYSLDDKLIDYLNKPFIVKPDRTVYVLDEEFPLNSETDWSKLAERIVQDGEFQLFGFTKHDLNRRERRLNAKKKPNEEIESESKLKWKKVEEINPVVSFSDLIWGKLLGF